jgi:large subunit ribosomal protein L10
MGEIRNQKAAVVEEVRDRIASTEALVLTEYRGLDVPALAELRAALRAAGGEYKVYKNTLVRLAVHELDLDLEELLVGPTALAFVAEKPDGTKGDAAAVAKALKDFAKDNDSLVVKGGLLDGELLSPAQIESLAKLPPREVLLAQIAGALAAPLQKFAGLLNALPQNMAYALKALLDERAAGAPAEEAEEAPAEEAPAEEAPAEEAEEAPAEEAEEAPAEEIEEIEIDEATAEESEES